MNTAERLKKLRLIRDVSWEKLGEELELGRTMLHYVRRGERELGERALYRLVELERAAGIASSAKESNVKAGQHLSLEELSDTLEDLQRVLDKVREEIKQMKLKS